MTDKSRKKSLAGASAARDKKASGIVLFKTKGILAYADYLLICSGRSDRQVQAIAQSIENQLKKLGHRPLGVEGMSQGRWVLIDYGDVVVHVFQESVRDFYDLEGLWIDAPRVRIRDEKASKRTRKGESRVAS